jgi:cupin fold WbuC family metalloprotein
MKILNLELLNSITAKAKESPRLRMNYNFHESPESKAQILLNSLEPGTVLPVHRHQNTSETYILLKGSLKVLIYSENKELLSSTELDPANGVYGVEIPAGQWHKVEVLETGTVIFEVKEGPYTPITEEDTLTI